MKSKYSYLVAIALICTSLSLAGQGIGAEKGGKGGHAEARAAGGGGGRAESRAPIRQEFERVRSKMNTATPKEFKANFNKTMPERVKNETQQASQVRENIKRTHPESSNWFNQKFFNTHNYSPEYNRRGNDWGRRSRWGGVSGWLGWNANSPLYYTDEGYPVEWAVDSDYDQGPYQGPDNQIYVQQQINQQQINQQQLAQEQGGGNSDWMPLGSFALGTTIPTASTSNLYIELAVSKEGDLSGTYYDANADRTYPILGIVDKDSQLAAWKISDVPNAPLMTTGIYNLTRDVVPISLHSDDGTKKNEVLVNLNP